LADLQKEREDIQKLIDQRAQSARGKSQSNCKLGTYCKMSFFGKQNRIKKTSGFNKSYEIQVKEFQRSYTCVRGKEIEVERK